MPGVGCQSADGERSVLERYVRGVFVFESRHGIAPVFQLRVVYDRPSALYMDSRDTVSSLSIRCPGAC